MITDEEREQDARAWTALVVIWLRWPIRLLFRVWDWFYLGDADD